MNWFCMAHDHPDPVLIKTKWCVNKMLHLVVYKFHFWRSLVLIKHRLLIYVYTCHMYVNKINERTHFSGTFVHGFLYALKLCYISVQQRIIWMILFINTDNWMNYVVLDTGTSKKAWYQILFFFAFDPFYRAKWRLVMSVAKCTVSVVDWQNTSICTCIQY
jgi:hypothetical protein